MSILGKDDLQKDVTLTPILKHPPVKERHGEESRENGLIDSNSSSSKNLLVGDSKKKGKGKITVFSGCVFTVGIILCQLLTLCCPPHYQAVPGNDQNASPTNQETAGSKVDRTSQLMFYGSWRHLESFSGGFLLRICLLGCLLRYLVKVWYLTEQYWNK